MSESNENRDQEFVSDDGDVITRRQMGYYVRYEQGDIELIEDGFMIDGTEYTLK